MFLQRGTCVNLRAGGFALLFHVSDAKSSLMADGGWRMADGGWRMEKGER
jgi:hypothetical protein